MTRRPTPVVFDHINGPLIPSTPDNALINALYSSFPYSNWTTDAKGNAMALLRSLDRTGWELVKQQRVPWWRRLLRRLHGPR